MNHTMASGYYHVSREKRCELEGLRETGNGRPQFSRGRGRIKSNAEGESIVSWT